MKNNKQILIIKKVDTKPKIYGKCRYCNQNYGNGYNCDHYHSMTPKIHDCFPQPLS